MYANLKKKYGQNFLIDQNILNKITNLIDQDNLSILEIGPGNGNLTNKILSKKPKKFDLIEIDKDLASDLKIKFSEHNFVRVINQNILDTDINQEYDLIISNLPYNISSQILVKLSLLENRPPKLILMFQKEFSSRLLDKKINSINSLVRCFYNIKFNFNVSRNCFRPIPKIESSVLTFEIIDNLIKKYEINDFIAFKRKLFSHKRKTMQKVLKNYNLEGRFNLNLRVEDINLAELIKIFRATNS